MSTAVLSVPPLRDGERLSRDEFERRYEAMPDVKAELLDGVVYMASPVSADHGDPDNDLGGWICFYKGFTPGVAGGHDTTVRLSGSEPRPDVNLRILATHGGQSHIDDDRYIAGAPELLGEIALSSVSYDLTIKKPIYCRNGVREFILWRIDEAVIDWYILRDGDYVELPLDPDGIIRSETFPGLWLDVEAMVRGDIGSVLRALQRGIASQEHADFVAQLEARRAQR